MHGTSTPPPHRFALAVSADAARIDPPGAVLDQRERCRLAGSVMYCRGWPTVVHAETIR
jgi:hypothetical protein